MHIFIYIESVDLLKIEKQRNFKCLAVEFTFCGTDS